MDDTLYVYCQFLFLILRQSFLEKSDPFHLCIAQINEITQTSAAFYEYKRDFCSQRSEPVKIAIGMLGSFELIAFITRRVFKSGKPEKI